MRVINSGVRVYLQGGLGNQLFQFAAGLATARRLEVDLTLDCRRLGKGKNSHRYYSLAALNLPTDVRILTESGFLGAFMNRRAVNRLKNLVINRHYIEPSADYDPAFENIVAGTTLDGYFQSSKYFQFCETEVRDAIMRARISPEELLVIDALSSEPFTAVHVRRGDYMDPKVSKIHGLAKNAYFERALQFNELKKGQQRKIYFSDNPDIVSAEFAVELKDFAPNSLSELATILLMARASNIIASNSSFSWWAGYLASGSKPTTVIVPEPWYATETPRGLLPSNWIKLNKY